jgi:hypothetical protein
VFQNRRTEITTRIGTKFLGAIVAGILGLALLVGPSTAEAANFCIQLSTANGNINCDFTGDAGFFRFFRAKLPKNAKRAIPLHGRTGGVAGVYGTMVMDSSGSSVSLTASFTSDASYGTIDLFINPGLYAGDHFGYSSYNSVDLANSCNVRIVDCSLEP